MEETTDPIKSILVYKTIGGDRVLLTKLEGPFSDIEMIVDIPIVEIDNKYNSHGEIAIGRWNLPIINALSSSTHGYLNALKNSIKLIEDYVKSKTQTEGT